jgi:hypothetical protein
MTAPPSLSNFVLSQEFILICNKTKIQLQPLQLDANCKKFQQALCRWQSNFKVRLNRRLFTMQQAPNKAGTELSKTIRLNLAASK